MKRPIVVLLDVKVGDRVVYKASPSNPEVTTCYIGTVVKVEGNLIHVETEGYGPGCVSAMGRYAHAVRLARPEETPMSAYRDGWRG